MRPNFLICLVGMSALLIGISTFAAAEDNKLVGTWKLKSATLGGATKEIPEAVNIYKHVTPTHFVGVTYDKDGKFIRSHGGKYVKKGDEYVETVEFTSIDAMKVLIGKESKFTCRFDGDQWLHKGATAAGAPIDEVWVRVK